MKPDAINHPKMFRLAERLGVPRVAAVGLMECFWHWVCANAPDGDIFNFTAGEIAAGARWDGDPEMFLAALIDCGWIDASIGVLDVHDWWEHRNDPMRRDYAPKSPKARRWLRMRAAGGTIADAVRRAVFLMAHHRCELCAATKDLTIDHLIPISRGGTNTRENLRCLCRTCNSKKGDRLQ